MTNQEALELGLVLAELESQLKARETPASPEEAGEMLREIMVQHAGRKQHPGSDPQKPKLYQIKPGAAKRALEEQLQEEKEEGLRNPKGVPVIFPGHD